jgi:hypothetical protein
MSEITGLAGVWGNRWGHDCDDPGAGQAGLQKASNMVDDAVGVDHLRKSMTDEQIEQFAKLLEDVVRSGFGEVEVVVIKGRVRFFRPQLSIAACYDKDID